MIPSERHPDRSTPERVINCSTAVVEARTRSAVIDGADTNVSAEVSSAIEVNP